MLPKPAAPAQVCVVGGGWSVKGIDISALTGTVIGVNDSAIHAYCDIAVSMDRLWTEYRFEQLRGLKRETWLRRSAVQNLKHLDYPWLHVFECDHRSVEFATEPGRLNGTNSGICAINRAVQLRPKLIILLGFDMCRGPNGEAHWYKPYPWTQAAGATSGGKFAQWASEFESIAMQCRKLGIEVLNASPASAITAFPKTDAFHKYGPRFACAT